MGDVKSTAPNTVSAEWKALSKQYADMQNQAFKSKDVKEDTVKDLRDKLTDYINTNVTDAAQKESMLDTVTTDLGSMLKATKTNEGSAESDKSWDAATAEMESLLTELAPEGADAVWTPANDVPKLNNFAKTDGATEVASGSGDVSAAAGSISGVPMISLEDMAKKFPEIKPYMEMFVASGKKYNVPPQLLAAQALQESRANTDARANGNMMQFTNGDTWRAFGDPSIAHDQISSSNIPQQVEAAAKYDSYLLGNHGGDLNKALLEYSGGLDFYPNGIKSWLSGNDGHH